MPENLLPANSQQPANELRQAVEAHRLDLLARRLSPATVTKYGVWLGAFVVHLEGQGVGTPQGIQAEHIRAYLAGLANRGLSAHTQHTAARCIRAWCNFLAAEEVITESPMRKVKMPKLDNRIMPAFSETDVKALLDACLSGRDKALILFMLDTGLRASEVLAVNLGDVDMGTGAVMVRLGKGGKDRQVYIGAKTRQTLQRYLRRRKDAKTLAASSPLWVSLRGGRRLRRAGLRQVLRRLAERSGVEHCHPHTFRRTFALWSLRAGMDIYSLQRLMGHSDLTMLRRYLALVESDLQNAHRKHGPVDSNL